MTSYIGSIVVLGMAMAMILLGRARSGVSRPFLRSYPVGVAYTVTTMTLLVFGIAWLIVGSR